MKPPVLSAEVGRRASAALVTYPLGCLLSARSAYTTAYTVAIDLQDFEQYSAIVVHWIVIIPFAPALQHPAFLVLSLSYLSFLSFYSLPLFFHSSINIDAFLLVSGISPLYPNATRYEDCSAVTGLSLRIIILFKLVDCLSDNSLPLMN